MTGNNKVIEVFLMVKPKKKKARKTERGRKIKIKIFSFYLFFTRNEKFYRLLHCNIGIRVNFCLKYISEKDHCSFGDNSLFRFFHHS